MRVAGVDGTRGGWVAVELHDGAIAAVHHVDALESGFEQLAGATMVAIDVPIGFGPRRADALARRELRGAASTVFTVPGREVLERPFGPGLGVSAQAHALGPRIVHVTALAREDERFRETHPELSFRTMNGGVPLRFRKRSAGGVLERLALLRREGIEPRDAGGAATVPVDDLLDAVACAWTARRIADGSARSLPDPPEVIDGLRVAIWA